VYDKKDSTGICFIGERPFREFLNRYLPADPGEIWTLDGQLVGRHMGLMFYTIGQRQGLGIGGQRRPIEGCETVAAAQRADGDAWYVAAKDIPNNRLLVVQGRDHDALLNTTLTAIDLNWISGTLPHCNWVYGAKTRYRQKDAPCTISRVDSESCDVEFAEPQWAVTPGQSVVVYESRVCLGGGIIRATEAEVAAA
jgi:tRNA-specific 2-thiouridylase